MFFLCFYVFYQGKIVKKEPGNEESHHNFDDADKLLQEFQEAQVDRVCSRPSSNLSSLSNASESNQHHLGVCCRMSLIFFNIYIVECNILCLHKQQPYDVICFLVLFLGSPSHLGVGDQSEMVHDPYEFLQSPEPEGTSNS